MVMGGAAGTLASSLCYPLDTIRRRMQMVGRVYDGQLDAFATIWREVLRLPAKCEPDQRLSYARFEQHTPNMVRLSAALALPHDRVLGAHSCAQGSDTSLSCARRRASADSTEAGP